MAEAQLPEKPLGFVSFLAERGVSAERWREMAARREPRAFELQFEWQNAYDEWLKATGQHPEFNEAALVELGISIDDWRAMAPGERVATMTRWFGSRG